MNSLMKLFVSLSLLFFTSLVFGEINGVEGSHKHHHHLKSSISKKLFVFGDSYVDTGNIKKSPDIVAWKFPYGITFPGKPVGRFSDGRVSTDFLANLMGIKSPIPYIRKDHVPKERLQYGMNFGVGGTGVFDTPSPNMTTQIDSFQKLLGDIYSPSDLNSSVALVSVAGNDYINYIKLHPAFTVLTGILKFIQQVVNQIEVNLRRIHALGVKKIAIPTLQPIGCLPLFSKDSSSQKCNDILNGLVKIHNSLLQGVVAKLNKETKKSTFVTIDLFNAFLTIIENRGDKPGSTKFETPLKCCCEGECATVDEKGEKKYTLCDDPKSALFWDVLHPTQEGWTSVYSVLGKNITASLIKP
uniref:GDSL esterase/lipase n=1 Tax=Noccaea caerulescens TaxID=107243 RepID=A0A1J3HYC0_NOCCA